MKLRTLTATTALALALAGGAAAAPVLDGGWAYDDINAVQTPSTFSPYVLNLATPAWFRITDAFSPGDTFTVTDSILGVILTTSFQAFPAPFGDDPFPDSAWTDASFGSGETLLAMGNYSLTVTGDGFAGLPAGFYVRLDSARVGVIPLPPALPLLGGGLALFGLLGWRRRTA